MTNQDNPILITYTISNNSNADYYAIPVEEFSEQVELTIQRIQQRTDKTTPQYLLAVLKADSQDLQNGRYDKELAYQVQTEEVRRLYNRLQTRYNKNPVRVGAEHFYPGWDGKIESRNHISDEYYNLERAFMVPAQSWWAEPVTPKMIKQIRDNHQRRVDNQTRTVEAARRLLNTDYIKTVSHAEVELAKLSQGIRGEPYLHKITGNSNRSVYEMLSQTISEQYSHALLSNPKTKREARARRVELAKSIARYMEAYETFGERILRQNAVGPVGSKLTPTQGLLIQAYSQHLPPHLRVLAYYEQQLYTETSIHMNEDDLRALDPYHPLVVEILAQSVGMTLPAITTGTSRNSDSIVVNTAKND